MAPVSALAEAGARLLELHGQHAQQSLLDAGRPTPGPRRLRCDRPRSRSPRPGPLRAPCTPSSTRSGGDDRARAREADLLRYQLAEIDAAGLGDPDEDDALADEEERLAEAAAHRDAAAVALAALDSGDGAGAGAVVDLLGTANGALTGGPRWPELAARLAVAPGRRVRHRLRAPPAWSRPGTTIPSGWTRCGPAGSCSASCRASTARAPPGSSPSPRRPARASPSSTPAEERAAALRAEIDAGRGASWPSAEADVGAARRRGAPELARGRRGRLRTLAMPHARLEVTVAERDPGDDVTFLLGANPGEPVLPLAKVASGGELARAMLALRLVLTEAPPTMVFDEVDAGVGGEAAPGGRARPWPRWPSRHQVLVVTHLAQVAAYAGQQLGVRKEVTEGPAPWPTAPCSTPRAGWSSWPGCCRVSPVGRRPAATPRSSSAQAVPRDHAAPSPITPAARHGRDRRSTGTIARGGLPWSDAQRKCRA